jgi:hypothetical protein
VGGGGGWQRKMIAEGVEGNGLSYAANTPSEMRRNDVQSKVGTEYSPQGGPNHVVMSRMHTRELLRTQEQGLELFVR